ncbi:metal transporter Nramp2-like [Cynara cardunculus var. scolymus]|uniref:Natural resistance-associated macrophage protein n=1 Tax=Cynara cardunculus var. scolymus TaxID=59895 RepID=A0A103XWQ4_CYNCS|nr:metal transporter Nramp2-like [Cynara cardunculus var. scolymus]KVH98279.1 Natural resistance-associated macrophage protein [Cynara cardunculus var. scolymus]
MMHESPHDQHNTESKSEGDEEDHHLLLISQSPLPLSTDNNPKDNYVSDEEEVAYESHDKIVIDGLDSDSDNTDFNSTPPFSWKKLWLFTGPGFLMSIAFLDPGNLEGDLQAGAIAGYSLLWLLMWATGMGLLIQLLSARVGVATGRHLSELCREEYPRWAGLLLWFMAEIALIGADIQEVIGSAIAIQILSNGILPLWAGVVITASDCFMFLLLENYGVRNLEAVFAVLISTMGLSFAWMFADAQPSGKELLIGLLVPKLSSRTIRQAVGVVGCVIMPHNVFLHSALVQSRKIDPNKKGRVQEAINYYTIESSIALFVSFMINLFVTTVFAKGFYGTKQADSIGLVNAGQYLEQKYGGGFMPVLYIWGIGLLAAGQSSTITGTYAGQFIMGGFLNLRLKKWLRALITRSCAIVPTMIVALVFNKSEASLDVLNEWLNVLQSIQIPFALIPLLTLVSKEEVMGVFKIGPTLERIAWSVAALVMVINGYLLLDFFVAEVNGFLFGALAVTSTSAYVVFILYLISHGDCLPSTWFSHIVNKGYSYIGK